MAFWVITDHAVEQYVRRWAPDITSDEARSRLRELLESSTNAGRTALGDEVRESRDFPGVRAVIKDRKCCVTVLPRASELPAMPDLHEPGTDIQAEMDRLEQELADLEYLRKVMGPRRAAIFDRLTVLRNRLAKT